LEAYPRLQTYLKVSKFEIKNHNPVAARTVFEKIPLDLGDEAFREDYFLSFARFEIRNKEYDRARAIFKFGLEKIPKERAGTLYEEYLAFEKQWGAKEEIDELIINKRRNKYKGNNLLELRIYIHKDFFSLIYLIYFLIC
jgi:crooked neck